MQFKVSFEFWSVRTSVCFIWHHFSQDWLISFLFIFCIKLRDHNFSKPTEPIFWGENIKVPKWPRFVHLLLLHFSQNWLVSFFNILHELRDHKYSKLTKPNFLGKFLLIRKRTKKTPRMVRFICSLIMTAFFLRISSIDLSHILRKVEGPQVLKTNGNGFFSEINPVYATMKPFT